MVEWGDADDDGYPDTEEGHNEYEKDCQSGKQPWKGHKIFHDRYRAKQLLTSMIKKNPWTKPILGFVHGKRKEMGLTYFIDLECMYWMGEEDRQIRNPSFFL